MDLVTLGLAKKYTRQKILEASLEGGEGVDLSGYAKKTELPTKVSQLTNDSGFISKVPDDYATEAWVQEYVEEHSGQNVELDATLTQSGKAADAKAVGERLAELSLGGSLTVGDPVYTGYIGDTKPVLSGPVVSGWNAYETIQKDEVVDVTRTELGKDSEATIVVIPAVVDTPYTIQFYNDELYQISFSQKLHNGSAMTNAAYNYNGTSAVGSGILSNAVFTGVSNLSGIAQVMNGVTPRTITGYAFDRASGVVVEKPDSNANPMGYTYNINRITASTLSGTCTVLIYPRALSLEEITALFMQFGGDTNE